MKLHEQLWFIILIIILLMSLFFMWKDTKWTKTIKSMNTILIIIMVSSIILFLNLDNKDKANHEKTSTSEQSKEKDYDTYEMEIPITIEDVIQENFKHAEITTKDEEIIVNFEINTTASLDNIETEIANTLTKIQSYKFSTVQFIGLSIDKEEILREIFSKETIEAINEERGTTLKDNLETLADDYYVDSDLK